MPGPQRSGPTPTPLGGDARAWRPSWRYLVLALAVAAAGPLFWLMSSPTPHAHDTSKPSTVTATPARADAAAKASESAKAVAPVAAVPVRTVAATAASVPATAPPPEIARTRDPSGDQTPDLADYVNPGERPTMAEVITRLHQAGVYSGLGAFSPPGTRPPLIGLAVPEDFVLPEGYVRHHQATDDGQRIEPILMFSPDYQWVDANGQPVTLPPDRVVPPELAPAGLPIRRVVVPAPIDPGK